MATFTQEREVVIGIDLGTTYSCVAVWDAEHETAKVLPNLTGGRTTPSYVAFTEQTKIVGQAAKSQAPSNPANTVYDVKRIIGRKWHDDVVQQEAKQMPFKVVDGGGRPVIEVEWRGKTKRLAPEMISSMVLAELKRAAEVALGHKVTQAVVTVPAHFNDQQRQATKDAGRIAGLDIRRIINEPTAAALAYGLHGGRSGANVVIFDLGGGTFDVSVLSMEEGVLEVKATGGDTHLGGQDFDENLVNWCISEWEKANGKASAAKLRGNARALRRLRTACEDAKRAVSAAPSVRVEVESLLDDRDLSAELTRAAFESMNSALFDKCMATVTGVLQDAKITAADVTDIVLVGGSTRIPALQDRLSALFDGRVELCRSINPDEAVAVGAAVQGHILASGGSGGGQELSIGGSRDIVLLDVTPLSLGIELEGREMSVLIKRNTPIPCQKSRQYTTVEDYQTEIDVVVYEGERRSVDACNKLGEFKIGGVQRAKKGEPKVEVTFTLDANGILHVSARDKVTGSSASTKIAAKDGRLSDEEIELMVAEAEKYRAEDAEAEEKATVHTALEQAALAALSAARGKGDEEAISFLEGLQEWLDYDSLHATLQELQNRAQSLREQFGVTV